MKVTSDQINLIALISGPVIALIFFILGLTAKKPSLMVSGSGGSSINIPGKDIMASSISIKNHPKYLGINIPRETANIVSARLYDPSLKRYVNSELKWRINGAVDLSQTVSIRAGQAAELYLLAKERFSEEYFVFSSNRLDVDTQGPITKYRDQKKNFSVVLFDEIGRKYQFGISVINSDQSVDLSPKVTSYMRLQMIKNGFGMIIRAFSFRS